MPGALDGRRGRRLRLAGTDLRCGPVPLTCIGSLSNFFVVVPASGGTFVLGEADATARITIQRGKTEAVQESLRIQVQPTVLVDLPDTARLESGGGAVSLGVVVACPVGSTPEQSYVNVSQGQRALGNGTHFPICDGRQHTITVRVAASQGRFETGEAPGLTFATVLHRHTVFSGVDDAQLQIVS